MASLAIPEIKVGDWNSVRIAFQKLKSLRLGTDAIPTFGGLTFSKICLVAAGLNVLRVTGLQTDDVAMSGTLRGAYIDVSNGSIAATGTIRGMELKARTEAPGDTGNDVAVLEGLSISADSKGHSATTMRAAEFILDGKTGGTIGEAVGLRIANNLQADKATVSYGLQIYRDSFDYTADIQLSSGGLIGGSTGALKITSGGNVSITNLTASRLMASNADKVLISNDLINWVTGTVNRVNVSGDGSGGVTLSGPQDYHTGAEPTFAGLKLESELFIKEQAAADSDQAGYGQIWVKNTTPNELWFTDDVGNDVQLSSFSRCSVYLSGDQTIATSTWTQIVFDTEDFDGNSEFNISTHRFTPKVAGYYIVSLTATLEMASADEKFAIAIKKTGNFESYNVISGMLNINYGICTTKVVYLSTEDYIEGFVWHDYGNTRLLVAERYFTSLTIHRLS